MARPSLVEPFADLSAADTALVGGKNAALGELIANLTPHGIRVPDGFATTTAAYRELLDTGDLRARIGRRIEALHEGAGLAETGAAIRGMILATELPPRLVDAVTTAYTALGERLGRTDPDVAVRSSATAEDLPEASFAGQQESFLNITGARALLDACLRCYASLFTDRAINYREHHGFDHLRVALSVGVQQMVRADRAGAGVMFSLDTDSGFPRVVLVNAAWGLGESVVSGAVDPDEYLVFKPLVDEAGANPVIAKETGGKQSKVVSRTTGAEPTVSVPTTEDERAGLVLTDSEIRQLARWAVRVERHYDTPMDMEWAKDGDTGELHLVQARPETVQTRRRPSTLRSYRLTGTGHAAPLVTGLAIGEAIAAGTACVLRSAAEIDRFVDGAVLVTGTTDPDWEPVMKRAAALVTDHGGRTSHAAIVSRELGLGAVVGTGDATGRIPDGRAITVSCAEGERGVVYPGTLDFEEREIELTDIPTTRTRLMLTMADPGAALRWWRLPADGVGLARMEFVINNHIRVHPMALVHPERTDAGTRERIAALTRGYRDRTEFFVDRLAYGIARIAAAWWPAPVVVRTSDFKTNEYARLLGGAPFEPAEQNPMLGWRGASRYHDDGYREGFALECRALRRVRDEMGLTNTVVMIPFCRTLTEADRVLETLADHGLRRGANGLAVYVMVEIPANVLLADDFARRFDGFSIGSNDLTQLTLGVDRDSERLAGLFDERDPAVVRSIRTVIEAAHRHGREVGLCGQRPSDDPEFARLLVDAGIDSVSVAPDSFLRVKNTIAAGERRAPEGDPDAADPVARPR
ncbi:phosphoenolpyruvate synthase [Saccharomonospora iraqiensis]|uniref:phosphoenolpyruvate synthase n=1 Tax=Saccharomonospora iraqiensis TaxID=52698 RepID=UPI00022E2B4C|nr:phosphoenolpyruvate synthase [Saccharomonospora iraqiensis]